MSINIALGHEAPVGLLTDRRSKPVFVESLGESAALAVKLMNVRLKPFCILSPPTSVQQEARCTSKQT